jgi:two-component system response regulator FlrC
MRQHPWPGNVRELENVIQRALLMADTDHITSDDLGLPANMSHPVTGAVNLATQVGREWSMQARELQPSSMGHPAADTFGLTNIQPNVEESGMAPYVEANAYDGDRSATTPVVAAKEDAVDMRSIERDHILQVLRTVNGSRRRAVELLGISERALRYKLKSYREAGHEV